MEINYTRKHNDSVMSIVGQVDAVDYEKKMIEANKIGLLLDFSVMEINGMTHYNYTISRMENVEDYLEGMNFSLEAIEKIVINLQIALSELEKYLIDENHILLRKETLFLERANGSVRIQLCYYPVDNGTIQEQFRGLMEYIITHIDSGDRKNAEKIFGLYDICVKDDYTLEELRDFIQENKEEEPEIIVNKIELEPTSTQSTEDWQEPNNDFSENLYDLYPQEEKKNIFSELFAKVKGSFGKNGGQSFTKSLKFEDFIVEPTEEIEEKTVLLKDAVPAGKLVYDGQSDEENFIITKDIFRIGSGKNNDAVLHSRAVSSTHAKIYRENGSYFLEDLNSLNGSFVGSNLLEYKNRVKLKTMDVIRFADVQFVFM